MIFIRLKYMPATFSSGVFPRVTTSVKIGFKDNKTVLSLMFRTKRYEWRKNADLFGE